MQQFIYCMKFVAFRSLQQDDKKERGKWNWFDYPHPRDNNHRTRQPVGVFHEKIRATDAGSPATMIACIEMHQTENDYEPLMLTGGNVSCGSQLSTIYSLKVCLRFGELNWLLISTCEGPITATLYINFVTFVSDYIKQFTCTSTDPITQPNHVISCYIHSNLVISISYSFKKCCQSKPHYISFA